MMKSWYDRIDEMSESGFLINLPYETIMFFNDVMGWGDDSPDWHKEEYGGSHGWFEFEFDLYDGMDEPITDTEFIKNKDCSDSRFAIDLWLHYKKHFCELGVEETKLINTVYDRVYIRGKRPLLIGEILYHLIYEDLDEHKYNVFQYKRDPTKGKKKTSFRGSGQAIDKLKEESGHPWLNSLQREFGDIIMEDLCGKIKFENRWRDIILN